jgi:hypothetical protein
MRVVLTSRLIMSQAVSVLSLLQYTNNSNLPHRGGLFVKILGYKGCSYFPADDVPGGECPLSTEITATYLIRVVSVVSS